MVTVFNNVENPGWLAGIRVFESPEQWQQEVEWYLRFGYAYFSPFCTVLARPFRHDATVDEAVNPQVVFEAPDAWYVHYFSGDFRFGWKCFPVAYPWICWQKDGRLFRYRTTNIHTLLFRYGKRIDTESPTPELACDANRARSGASQAQHPRGLCAPDGDSVHAAKAGRSACQRAGRRQDLARSLI